MSDLEKLPDDDVYLRYNVLVQAVDVLTNEHGHAGDATRQLRVISQEMCRRNLFLYMLGDLNDAQVMTRYAVLDQLFAGWPETPNVEDMWRAVIQEMKIREMTIPPRVVTVDPLLMTGRAVQGE